MTLLSLSLAELRVFLEVPGDLEEKRRRDEEEGLRGVLKTVLRLFYEVLVGIPSQINSRLLTVLMSGMSPDGYLTLFLDCSRHQESEERRSPRPSPAEKKRRKTPYSTL